MFHVEQFLSFVRSASSGVKWLKANFVIFGIAAYDAI